MNNTMQYRRCGKSGLLLPAMSLGFWKNFGTDADGATCREMVLGAFDRGITCFDLANNYGPLPGSAEERFGEILSSDLASHRDEMVITTKAGHRMWEGPYQDGGSRKYLVSSLDQSLKRMRLDYVDIFYHHRPDPDTPLEETMTALSDIVHSGKALYVGISKYSLEETKKAVSMLSSMGVHCLVNQIRLSLLDRKSEEVVQEASSLGIGTVAFSPLCQGVLTGKYLSGIPSDSRMGTGAFTRPESVTEEMMEKTRKLSVLAKKKGVSLTDFSLAWILSHQSVTSVILGARNMRQIEENLEALEVPAFTAEELAEIDAVCD